MNANQNTKINRSALLSNLFATAGGMLLSGCGMISAGSQGSMVTQSGQAVTVSRDIWGKDYYYENGAKVYVNETGGIQTSDRPTDWRP
jgi:hypothetical protein